MSDYIFFHLIIHSRNVWHVREHMVSNSLQQEQGQSELVHREGSGRVVDLAAFVAVGGWRQMATPC